eukprot:Clim_evm6s141 gene=Clim_evmTU6s141
MKALKKIFGGGKDKKGKKSSTNKANGGAASTSGVATAPAPGQETVKAVEEQVAPVVKPEEPPPSATAEKDKVVEKPTDPADQEVPETTEEKPQEEVQKAEATEGAKKEEQTEESTKEEPAVEAEKEEPAEAAVKDEQTEEAKKEEEEEEVTTTEQPEAAKDEAETKPEVEAEALPERPELSDKDEDDEEEEEAEKDHDQLEAEEALAAEGAQASNTNVGAESLKSEGRAGSVAELRERMAKAAEEAAVAKTSTRDINQEVKEKKGSVSDLRAQLDAKQQEAAMSKGSSRDINQEMEDLRKHARGAGGNVEMVSQITSVKDAVKDVESRINAIRVIAKEETRMMKLRMLKDREEAVAKRKKEKAAVQEEKAKEEAPAAAAAATAAVAEVEVEEDVEEYDEGEELVAITQRVCVVGPQISARMQDARDGFNKELAMSRTNKLLRTEYAWFSCLLPSNLAVHEMQLVLMKWDEESDKLEIMQSFNVPDDAEEEELLDFVDPQNIFQVMISPRKKSLMLCYRFTVPGYYRLVPLDPNKTENLVVDIYVLSDEEFVKPIPEDELEELKKTFDESNAIQTLSSDEEEEANRISSSHLRIAQKDNEERDSNTSLNKEEESPSKKKKKLFGSREKLTEEERKKKKEEKERRRAEREKRKKKKRWYPKKYVELTDVHIEKMIVGSESMVDNAQKLWGGGDDEGSEDDISPSGNTDIAFLIDASNSMKQYIDGVKSAVRQVIDNFRRDQKALYPNSKLRIALVAYRDVINVTKKMANLIEVLALGDASQESHVKAIEDWLEGLETVGNDDYPEAVASGLKAVNELEWDVLAVKLCFWLGDAPPHGIPEYGKKDKHPDEEEVTFLEMMGIMQRRGIIVSAIGSGRMVRHDPYLCKVLMGTAASTGGNFILLYEDAIDQLAAYLSAACLQALHRDFSFTDTVANVFLSQFPKPPKSEDEAYEKVHKTLTDLNTQLLTINKVAENQYELVKRNSTVRDVENAMSYIRISMARSALFTGEESQRFMDSHGLLFAAVASRMNWDDVV